MNTAEMGRLDRGAAEKELGYCASRIRTSARRVAIAAFDIGRELEVAHGILQRCPGLPSWRAWVSSNVVFSRRTADRYRQLFRTFEPHRELIDRFEMAALLKLCQSATPPATLRTAIELAESGQFVNVQRVLQLIQTHTIDVQVPPKSMRAEKGRRIDVPGGYVIVKHPQVDRALQIAQEKVRSESTDQVLADGIDTANQPYISVADDLVCGDIFADESRRDSVSHSDNPAALLPPPADQR